MAPPARSTSSCCEACVTADPPIILAIAVMTAGLLAKTALVPAASVAAPAMPARRRRPSAVLSALVVKGSFILLLRLWFGVMAAVPLPDAAQILAGLGAAAILLGLRRRRCAKSRLKLLVAYSTVAQIGYLFLMFPLLASVPGARRHRRQGLDRRRGGRRSPTPCAKAAMFLAAGFMAARFGNDRIAELAGQGAPCR